MIWIILIATVKITYEIKGSNYIHILFPLNKEHNLKIISDDKMA